MHYLTLEQLKQNKIAIEKKKQAIDEEISKLEDETRSMEINKKELIVSGDIDGALSLDEEILKKKKRIEEIKLHLSTLIERPYTDELIFNSCKKTIEPMEKEFERMYDAFEKAYDSVYVKYIELLQKNNKIKEVLFEYKEYLPNQNFSSVLDFGVLDKIEFFNIPKELSNDFKSKLEKDFIADSVRNFFDYKIESKTIADFDIKKRNSALK